MYKNEVTENVKTDETSIEAVNDLDNFFAVGQPPVSFGDTLKEDNFIIEDNPLTEKEVIDTDKVEDKGEEVEDTKPDKGVEQEVVTKDVENAYATLYNELKKSNILQNEELVVEDEEGNEVPMDVDNLNMEDLVAIIKAKMENDITNIKNSMISTDGLSEVALKLIELDRNGGDIQEALQIKKDYINPMDNLDFTNEADLKEAIRLNYKAQGIKEKDIIPLINYYESRGELEDKALEAKEEFNKEYKNYLDDLNNKALELKNQNEERLKIYKKNLSENLKNYQLNDNYKKKILDFACKKGNDGRYELDTLFMQKRSDPKEAAELALFLINKDEYIKQMTTKAVRDEKLKTFKKLKVVKRKPAVIQESPVIEEVQEVKKENIDNEAFNKFFSY